MKLENVHPGEILKLDFLEPLGITIYRIAKDIAVTQTRISQIVRGKRQISVDTAMRLGVYFNTSAQFWLNLQNHYDLEVVRLAGRSAYQDIRPFKQATKAA